MKIAIVGGGPAGLMAAETAAAAGAQVDLYDSMPSVGRKLLLAGKGGLNLTHSEPLETFLSRYGARRPHLASFITSFGPDGIRECAMGLDVKTFIGTSRRVYPADLKAAPLLRVVTSITEIRCQLPRAPSMGRLGRAGYVAIPDSARASIGSVRCCYPGTQWRKLASVRVGCSLGPAASGARHPHRTALTSHCRFDVGKSQHVRTTFAGHAVKSMTIHGVAPAGEIITARGDCVVTETGLEGRLIYAASSHLRDRIETDGKAVLTLDVAPDRDVAGLIRDLWRPRGKRTIATCRNRGSQGGPTS